MIWKKDAASDNDTGRCLVGEFNANYPGYEFYYYQGNIIKADGTETDINTKGIKGGCSMAIWFDGSLIRQQMEDNIINSMGEWTYVHNMETRHILAQRQEDSCEVEKTKFQFSTGRYNLRLWP